MTKFALPLALGVFLVGFVLASSASSQEPAPDFGDSSPLVAACTHLTAVGENEGLVVKNCRRLQADEIRGNRAIVRVRLMTDVGPFELQVEMRKSLWNAVAWR